MLKAYFRNQEKIRVGEVLLQKGLINASQLKQALAIQTQSHEKLGAILVQKGLVSPSQLHQALFEQHSRNLAATLLFSVSALTAAFPKLALPKPVAVHHHNTYHQGDDLPAHPESRGDLNHDDNELTLSDAVGVTASAIETATSRTHSALGSPISPAQPQYLARRNQYSVKSPMDGFCHPLNGKGYLSQGIRGVTHQGRMEFAYDFAAGIGTPVYAMRAGKVIGVRDKYPDTGGGRKNGRKFNYVWLEHDDGYRSVYVHLQQGFRGKVAIKAGDWVDSGQLIGYSGNSGWSSGPHLHVEVQKPGSRRFSKTIPFAIAGPCNHTHIAGQPG